MKKHFPILALTLLYGFANAATMNSSTIATHVIEANNNNSEVSLATALHKDMQVFATFDAIAKSKLNTRKKDLTKLIVWAKAISENQLGSYNPVHFYNLYVLNTAQDYVDAGNYVEAANYLDSTIQVGLKKLNQYVGKETK